MTEFLKSFKVISMGELLQSFKLNVPPHQREYSWDKEDWSELWNDILSTMKHKQSENEFDKIHFLGPMFFVQESETITPEILDGQQRLATISLLLSVIGDLLYKSQQVSGVSRDTGYAVAEIEKSLFIRTSEGKDVRLTLNKKNNELYQKMIKISDPAILPEVKINTFRNQTIMSNKNILECYKFFYREIFNYIAKIIHITTSERGLPNIDSLDEAMGNSNSRKFLIDLYDTLVNKFYILQVMVPAYELEYKIYETLNQRGEKLEVKYLFKNLIFRYLERPLGEDEVERLWDTLDTITGDYFGDFLVHYWRSKYDFVREKDLFRAIRSHFECATGPAELRDFINEMIDEARIYVALNTWNDGLWHGRPKIAELLYDLNYLKLKQIMPLLLSSYSVLKDEQDKFEALIKCYINLAIRSYTVLGRNPNEFEEDYSSWARQFRNPSADVERITRTVITALQRTKPNDEEFSRKFIGLEISPEKARYLLCKINDSQEPTSASNTWRPGFGSEITLEHIIPKTPDEWWKDYMRTQNIISHEDIINRFGNMTILSQQENSELGNKHYEEKLRKYLAMGLPVNNKTFEGLTVFNEDAIKKREKILGDLAKHIW